jgi:hypothetical protein
MDVADVGVTGASAVVSAVAAAVSEAVASAGSVVVSEAAAPRDVGKRRFAT